MISKTDFDTAGDVLPRPQGQGCWLVAARLLAGPHPGAGGAIWLRQRLQALAAAGITHFVDLTMPSDGLPEYAALLPSIGPRSYRRHPIEDFGVPTVEAMRQTLSTLAAALGAGGNVYLHCRAGIGRTGTVSGCLLVEQGFGADEALALLQRKWQATGLHGLRVPETDEQRRFVLRWAAAR